MNSCRVNYLIEDKDKQRSSDIKEDSKTRLEDLPLEKLKSMQQDCLKNLMKLKEQLQKLEKSSLTSEKIKKLHIYNEIKVSCLNFMANKNPASPLG